MLDDLLDDLCTRYELDGEVREAVGALVSRAAFGAPATWLQTGQTSDGSFGGSFDALSPSPTLAYAPSASGDSPTLAPPPAVGDRVGGAHPPEHPRYEARRLLGRGATSVVFAVHDRELDRELAMKVLVHDPAEKLLLAHRFVAEARVMARLEHPGLVPVHDLGRLADGRLFYTMTKVQGRTLGRVIREFHGDGPASEDGTLRRLVDAFRRVCEAVAQAHAQGVIHRDLKPDNIMVGPFGQVLVLDWGLMKRVGSVDDEPAPAPATGQRLLPEGDPGRTRQGAIAGTPAYMSPEQARGEVDRLGPAADVYALGRVLEHLLTGRARMVGADGAEGLLRRLALGPAPDVPAMDDRGRPLPDALQDVAICCLQPEPAGRYPDAAALAAAVGDWLDGVRAQEEALAKVAEARARYPAIGALRAQAERLRAEADDLLAGVDPWEPEEAKAPAWRLQDEASEKERRAEVETVHVLRIVQTALELCPDLPEANALLADHYQGLHAAAEEARRTEEAARFEALLRIHDTGAHAAWLQGTGALTLVTEPAGARVHLFRYVAHNRRLVAEPVRALGTTPLVEVPLPMGSYLLRIEAEGMAPVSYPVEIRRGAHWDGVPPGGSAPAPVRLLPADRVGPDDCYVPAGWTRIGGDPAAQGPFPTARVWLDGFVARRFHVTNADYIAFLDDLVAQGHEALALRHAPKEHLSKDKAGGGAVVYHRTPTGGFRVGPDADGDEWLPDSPVIMIDLEGAQACAAWLAARTGLPWRLPWEIEHEKAARGVDGRFFPWGDVFDASWCMTRQSVAGELLPQPVTTFPVDESPYGVRGLSGHAMVWCLDHPHPSGPVVVDGRFGYTQHPDGSPDMCGIRGGSWNSHSDHSRAARRDATGTNVRGYYLGLRLVRGV
ncbi:MAG: SUMF1/EgtB/PvdO family nonheme iron enzyme [Alphaproteobacteria bacterium]|nr:SUMF1/EgtB/PvdO family nonheme iron enzyme [Alphaproteobacteria bacterium]